MIWYWFKCANGCKLLLRTNGLKNIGDCPYCAGDWLRITDEKEIAYTEAKMKQRGTPIAMHSMAEPP